MEIDTAKPNNPAPSSENVAGFQLTLLFSNSRYQDASPIGIGTPVTSRVVSV